jgi:hypothetical protein
MWKSGPIVVILVLYLVMHRKENCSKSIIFSSVFFAMHNEVQYKDNDDRSRLQNF